MNDLGRSPDGSGYSAEPEPEEVSAVPVSIPNAGLYVYSALVSRSEPGKTVTSIVQGVRLANNEDEVRGSAANTCWKLKPGFSIDEIILLRVEDERVLAAASAIEAASAGESAVAKPDAQNTSEPHHD